MLELISDALLIGSGAAFLYIFIPIAITGGYRAVEPNDAILAVEVIMSAVIFAVGLERFIDDLKQ